MRVLYTAYGFMLKESTATRPCGMARIVHLDTKKTPSKAQQRATCERAARRGYDTVVFFADDKCLRTVELW